MKDYKYYYIAFIDVLGFKSMVNNKSCNEIYEIYKSIKAMRTLNEVVLNNGKKESVPLIPTEEINIRVMSDSVCIFIESSIPYSLFELIFICIDYQNRMIELNPPVLLRGAITKGKLFSDGDLLYGPGFDQAYLMEEYNADVPRIIINKATIDDYEKQYPSINIAPNLFFRDYDAFYCTDYLSMYSLDEKGNRKDYAPLKKHVEDVLNSTTDDSIRKKYLYLETILNRYFKPCSWISANEVVE